MLNKKCNLCGKTHRSWNPIIKCHKRFADKVDWDQISGCQTLSEPFIERFADKVDWGKISGCQTLSEPFIERFTDKVDWDQISEYQTLSEPFIERFADKVNCDYISQYQIAFKKFEPTNLYDYAKKHKLVIKDGYLYAFRNHNKFGKGAYSSNARYSKGVYYKDWHCDLNPNNENSYGFGIWPKGNTPVRVKIEDWGTEVKGNSEGKARVWGFETHVK